MVKHRLALLLLLFALAVGLRAPEGPDSPGHESGPPSDADDLPMTPVRGMETPEPQARVKPDPNGRIPPAPLPMVPGPDQQRAGAPNTWSQMYWKDTRSVQRMVSSDTDFRHYCTVMADKIGPYVPESFHERVALGSARKFGEFPYSFHIARDLLRLRELNGAVFTTTKSTSFSFLSQLMKTFDRFPKSWAYICKLMSSDDAKYFVDEQLAGEPLFFTQLIWLFHHLKATDGEMRGEDLDDLKDKALLAILSMLQKQSVGDKIYLVSHGPDHGMRVMGQCSGLMNSRFFAKHSPLNSNSMHDRLAVMVTCLLHDVGYGAMPDASVLDLPKWTHARFSHDLLVAHVVPALSAVLPRDKIDGALAAIKNHNMDASVKTVRFADKWSRAKAEMPQCLDDPSTAECREEWRMEFPGLADLGVWPDAVWHREHVLAPIEEDPLLFSVRVADNMDSFMDRLLPAQRAYSGMVALKEMYSNPILVAKSADMSRGTITREEYVDAIRAHLGKSPDDPLEKSLHNVFAKEGSGSHLAPMSPVLVRKAAFDANPESISVGKRRFFNQVVRVIDDKRKVKDQQTIEMASKSAEQDFLHMYSVWVVRSFSWDQRSSALPLLKVVFRRRSEQKELSVEDNLGEAVYQVYRFAGSALTCMVGGERLTDKVRVELSVEQEAWMGPPKHLLSFDLRNLVLDDKDDQESVIEETTNDTERNLYTSLWRIATPGNGW